MRKALISLLVASAFTPAAVHAQDRGFGRADRSQDERSNEDDSPSADRGRRAQQPDAPERAARPARVERVERSAGSEPAVRADRVERPGRARRDVEQVQSIEPAQGAQSIEPAQPIERVVRINRGLPDQPVQQRRTDRRDDGLVGTVRHIGRDAQAEQQGQADTRREDGRGGFGELHDRIVRNGDRDRDNDRHRWDGNWRHDHRYDWRSYRTRYGSLYRLGRYYDPYGWGYRRYSTGFNLWPSYYGSGFWLNDPWQYRLPPAYGPYRWVRYYDDALLVDIYTGRVVDVIHGVFW